MGESNMINDLLIFGLLIILVIINGLEDGFRDKGKKILAHMFNSLHIAGWFCMITFDFQWIYVIQYVLIRFALFDVIWNLLVNQSIFYIGYTSLYDKFWRWFEKWTKWPMNHFLFMIKLISLLIAISFI